MFRKLLFPESQDFMIRLNCDYCKGALPEVLEALQTINDQAFCGYGCDEVCERAARLIRERAGAPSADVHFLVGGTQANFVVIESALRPWQSVICADSGHINVHETGAVEHAGHKCETAPAHDGKISADQVRAIAANWAGSIIPEHITQPKMVYLSMATETGSVYTLAELAAIRAVCDEFSLYLFIDGARLGYGLMTDGTDVTLQDVAHLCDVFYIGGTKVGTLFGEAVVITEPALKKDFLFMMKQHGARLAKGRLLGIQFDALFTDDLYLKISRHAIDMAHQIREIFVSAGYPLLFDSPTNQQYPILPDSDLAELGKSFGYEYWERVDETHSGVRFCASWATTQENVDALRAAVQALKQ